MFNIFISYCEKITESMYIYIYTDKFGNRLFKTMLYF